MNAKNKLQKIQDVWERITEYPENKTKNVSKVAKKRIKVTTIFAGNSVGKTRLSKHICDLQRESDLPYFNAYIVDLFSWDNDKFVLKFNKEKDFFAKIIDKEVKLDAIRGNFRKFIGLNITPTINFEKEEITFTKNFKSNGDDEKNIFEPNSPNKQIKLNRKKSINDEVNINITDSSDDVARGISVSANSDTEINDFKISGSENTNNSDKENIKISKGEESIFVWSIFFTILEKEIEDLSNKEMHLTQSDKPRYVVIDDPVSSMDDKRIITIALELGELIKKSKGKLEFIITTHHALFYNVLLNFKGEWNRTNYVLSKSADEYFLDNIGNKDPFAYHHHIISEIKKAIKDGKIEKYHFNQFRAILEKTANFLRCDNWRKLLPESEGKNEFVKMLNQFSHDRLSEIEPKGMSPEEKEKFRQVFESFIEKFEWFKHDSR